MGAEASQKDEKEKKKKYPTGFDAGDLLDEN